MYSFPNLEIVCYSTSGSNCCFLTCTQISRDRSGGVWYSHLLKNFPQFVVTHTVKGFGVVNKAEVNVFWNSLAFQWSSRCWQFDLWFCESVFSLSFKCTRLSCFHVPHFSSSSSPGKVLFNLIHSLKPVVLSPGYTFPSPGESYVFFFLFKITSGEEPARSWDRNIWDGSILKTPWVTLISCYSLVC